MARIRIIVWALFVTVAGTVGALRAQPVSTSMCGNDSSCGTCCYGDPMGCCITCIFYCSMEASPCCPGGWQMTSCF